MSHVKETSRGLSIEIRTCSSMLKKVEGIYDESRIFAVEQGRRKDYIRKKNSKLYQTAFVLVNSKLLQFLLNSADDLEILKEEIEDLELFLNHKI